MKLPYPISSVRNFIVYKIVNRIRRAPKVSVLTKSASKKSKNNTSANTSTPSFRILSALPVTKIILISGICLVISLLGIHIHIYNSIFTSELFPGEFYPNDNANLGQSSKHMLFIGFKELPNEQVGIGLLNLTTIDFETGLINLYTINANIKTFQEVPLRDYFMHFSFAEGKKYQLFDSIELLLGVQIDSYVAFNIEDYAEDLGKLGFGFSEFEGRYLDIDVVKNASLLDQDVVMNNQELFIKSLLDQLNIIQYYRFFLSGNAVSEVIKTDFSKEEILYLIFNLANLDKRYNLVSTTGRLVQKDDSTLLVNQVLIDEKVKSVSQKIQVLTEQAEVEIFNGSGKRGLATRKRRELDHIGVNVVRFGNYPDIVEETQVFIPQGTISRFRYTIEEIERNLGVRVSIDTENYDQNYTGDIIIVLGTDIH